MIDVPLDRFVELVWEAVEEMPDRLRARMDEVVIRLVDESRPGVLSVGDDLPAREVNETSTTRGPIYISLFRPSILADVETEREAVRRVRAAVIRELARHSGLLYRDHDLDCETTNRLLSGRVDPSDAPPGYGEAVEVLHTSAATLPAREAEAATVHPISSNRAPHRMTPRTKMRTTRPAAKLAAAAAAMVLFTTGVAAAANGSLPSPVQDIASHTLGDVGVSIPASHNHVGGSHGNVHEGHSTNSTITGPNAQARIGVCAAEDAHTTNSVTPHATVFVSASTCTSMSEPGSSADHMPKAQPNAPDATTTTEPDRHAAHGPTSLPAKSHATTSTSTR